MNTTTLETTTLMDACIGCAPAINIVLVGGRPMLRERLRTLLDGEPGLSVAAHAPSVTQALKACAGVTPDVVIVIPSGGPLARTMRALRKTTGARPIPTILLASAIEKTNIAQARALGVSGILARETPPQTLFDSVRRVADGHCWLGREAVEDLGWHTGRSPAAHANRFGLTKREMQVVEAVVRAYLTNLN